MDSSPAIDAKAVYDVLVRDRRFAYQVCAESMPTQSLPALVVKMVRLFEEQRSLAEVCQSTGITLAKGQAVTKKLLSLGVLRVINTECEVVGAAGFTDQEEEFFAAELAPIDECDEPFDELGQKIRRLLRKIRRR